ncbi:metalloregulator ArsR/SmtB family transcription factor [Desulfitobacterium sp.]|uniref:ArsR/SmtB family transcription factor n=1 Tax=Desulfitobacterium sp. TaxID=49981 RepID=UPI002B21208D|nr:metalloregulator ArsR/SmtB family transcription factor [Desulfitobacterium sp.]MEA4900902.1 metalloregulator ArsR/SmtB family transcription factor [Desulfitobacterium sp.]
MEKVTEEIEEMAEVLKAISHPIRLCIVCGLLEHSCNVSKIKECMSLPQSTVSKHVGILRTKGIIKGYRNGSEIIYKLVNDNVKKVVTTLMKNNEALRPKERTEIK